jgi:aarF domain-containing kinase
VGKVTGSSLRDFLREQVGERLAISDELMIGIGPDGQHDPAISSRLASLVLAKMPKPSASTADAASATANNAATGHTAAATTTTTTTTTTEKEKKKKSEKSEKGEKETAQRKRPVGASLLMNPTFFNNPRIREASIPAANGHFSARALARFYHSIAPISSSGGGSSGGSSGSVRLFSSSSWADPISKMAEQQLTQAKGELMLQGGSGAFAAGYVLYPCSTLDPPVSASQQPGDDNGSSSGGSSGGSGSSSSTVTSFGHGGIGGSVALCRCEGDRTLSVAVTLNRLSFDNDKTTGRILRAVYDKMNIPVPAAYQAKSAK